VNVPLAGGLATGRHYLKADQIGERHVVQFLILMGQGERIFGDVDGV